MSDPRRVRIQSIAAGGQGVGRLEEGLVVFVHRTAPGDVAEIEVVQKKKRWARGRLIRVLEPSTLRREPPCEFYAECGGCTLEHLSYGAQLAAKTRIVSDALKRISKLEVAPRIVASPRELAYRNRVSFTMRRLGQGRVIAGLRALEEPDRIIDIDGRCQLPEEALARAWDRLRFAWGTDARRLPSGEHLRLTLRATSRGEVSLLVEGGFAPGQPAELLVMVDGLRAIWHQRSHGEPQLLAGTPVLTEDWGGEALPVSGAMFLQVNRSASALLEEHVLACIGAANDLTVIDAYCGVGLYARRLSLAGARVVGIELDANAAEAARAAAPGLARFVVGPVENVLPALLPADVVILNPPRAGVAEAVTTALRQTAPGRLVYVSCDPATLARDLLRLGDAFELSGICCFDMFPQTAHVETVVLLERRKDWKPRRKTAATGQ